VFAFDRVLIAPTAADLDGALSAAAAAANGRHHARRVSWPPDDHAAFLDAWQAAEGRYEWANQERSPAQTFSAVGVAWWTDPLGRKHCRVVARRPSRYGSNKAALGVEPGRPPLTLVYPGETFLVERNGSSELVAACRCGASGEPASLGWMGPSCGPCHDRRERGEPLPGADFPARTVLDGPEAWVQQLVFMPDGEALLVRPALGGRVYIWAPATGGLRWQAVPGLRRLVALALTPDGRTAAAAGDEGGVVWRLDGRSHPARLQARFVPVSLAFAPDRVLLFDPAGRLLREITVERGLDAGRQTLAFLPDGRLVAATGQEVGLFDPATGAELTRLPGRLTHVFALACSPDGRAVAAADDQMAGTTLRLWRLPAGEEVQAASHRAAGLAFSPDGSVLAAACRDGRLRLWGVADGAPLGAFRWHGNSLGAVAFSPDGKWLATGDDDGVVRLWPAEALAAAAARG
jgi:sugar lactone lactonase YvrE